MSKGGHNDHHSETSQKLAAWSQRAVLARARGQADVERVAMVIATAYRVLLESQTVESDVLVKANALRKRIEAAEQHRTMAAEHGLNNEAIDVTYEIQELEKQLVQLVQEWERT